MGRAFCKEAKAKSMSKSMSKFEKHPRCPHCDQTLPQPRVERMTAQLAYALQSIALDGGVEKFIDVAAYGFRGLHARLRHWGLLEGKKGRWKVTGFGKDWLAGKVRVPEEIQVLQNRRVSPWTGPMISFEKAKALAKTPSELEAEAELEWLRERAREERGYLYEEE